MLNHILYFAILGVVLAIVFAITDKLIAKVKDSKKRKHIKIAVYAVLMFISACIVDIIVMGRVWYR